MGGVFGLFVILALVGIGLWIWALVDVVKVPNDSMFRAGNKLIWVLVIVFTGWIGAIIYLAVGKPQSGPGAHHDHDVLPPPPARPD